MGKKPTPAEQIEHLESGLINLRLYCLPHNHPGQAIINHFLQLAGSDWNNAIDAKVTEKLALFDELVERLRTVVNIKGLNLDRDYVTTCEELLKKAEATRVS